MMKYFRLGQTKLLLLMLFQKQKKLIYPVTYKKSKNYVNIAENDIKESVDLLKLNAILVTKLSISHIFVKIC